MMVQLLEVLVYLINNPVTIIGHLKGKTLEDNLKCNFGMSSPERVSKAMRLMKQAEKFKRVLLLLLSILQELIQE